MTTKTTTQYYVGSPYGGLFSQDGYSKYAERWASNTPDTIYGIEQAIEHAGEIKARGWIGELVLVSVTTVQTTVKI